MAKRRTVITIETHSMTVLQTRGQSNGLQCTVCGAPAKMIPVEQAADALSVTQRTIFRLVEMERVHFAETPAGRLFVCVESLRRHAEGSSSASG